MLNERKEKTGGIIDRKFGLRQIGSLGNRRGPKTNKDKQRHPLDKGYCAYCKKKDIRYLYRFF